MNQEEIYELIGRLAIALHAQNISISFTALNAILADYDCAYDSNRGLAAGVSAAYRHWESKPNLAFAHAIALTFLNKDGEHAWNR
jgi:hypothetical protein